jgi:glycosyltransferase involved in cell wall biosynthesis
MGQDICSFSKQKKKIKVAMLVTNLCNKGGTERVTSILSRNLNPHFDLYVITQWENGPISFELPADVPCLNLFNNPKGILTSALLGTYKAANFLKKNNIDVLMVMGHYNGLLPFTVKMISNIKLIFCEHCSVYRDKWYQTPLKKIISGISHTFIEHFPDLVVTLTKKDLAYYRDKKIHCTCIPNAIDSSLLNTESTYDTESKKIITVGRIDFQKGYEYLIEVAKRVLTQHRDWQWHIWGGNGTPEYTRKIESLIASAHLENQLFLKGTSPKMYEIYKDYSLYVMTSRFEGLPLVLLEAKASKLPVVSFDINSGPSDIVQNEIDGALIPPFDVDGMSERICELIRKPKLRKQYSDHARSNLPQFAEDQITALWIRTIEDVARHKN